MSGNTLYRVSGGGAVTALGVLANATNRVTLTDNAVQLGIADGQYIYCYTIISGTYAQSALNTAGSFGVVTDANAPNGATTISFINGRCQAELPNSRQYFVSNTYDLTNWGGYFISTGWAATYATKEKYPDQLIAVEVFNGLLLLSPI